MGKAAAFAKSRLHDARRKRDERHQRSVQVRAERLGVSQAERQIQHVVTQRPLPSEADRKLLLGQWMQACRLPGPSADLCALMKHYAGLETDATAVVGKRPRAESDPAALLRMADIFTKTQSTPLSVEGDEGSGEDEDGDLMTVLLDILQSDCGRRVVSTLLECLSVVDSKKCGEVAKIVLEEFEENEHLSEHHVACRVMSALAQFGTPKVQRGVLDLLRQRAQSLDGVVTLLTDRHTSVTIGNLVKFVPTETTEWLCEMLALSTTTAPKAAKARQVSEELLHTLIEDRMAGQVLRQLINATTRPLFLAHVQLQKLLDSKRGTAFLTALLTAGEEGSLPAPTAVAMLDSLLEQTSADLVSMCLDKRANFVVQKIIQLVLCTGKQHGEQISRLVHVMGGGNALASLATHGIGVHVLCTLIETTLKLSANAADDLGGMIVTRSNVSDLLCHQHGSLVIRRLMPLLKNRQHKTSQILITALEQSMTVLLYDQIGNLVVQEYLKNIGTAAASTFGRKLTKEDLFSMSRNPFASHVVFALLDTVDPATQVLLCNTLKPVAASLATHLNGRFIVERIIAVNRDVREDLARQFLALSCEKGTQHVLTSLVANLDSRGKQSLIEKSIIPNLHAMATHACGSIVLQKIMQSDATVRHAVSEQFSKRPHLRNDVAQNFYGKFVVQIAHSQ